MTESVTIENRVIEEILEFDDSESDANTRTHIVNPTSNIHLYRPGMTSQDIVDVARTLGIEVTALCGYIFVPKRDPDKYDACEPCMKMAGEIIRSTE